LNKILQNRLIAVLNITVGISIMIAPLSATVYAADKQPVISTNADSHYKHDGQQFQDKERIENIRHKKEAWEQKMKKYHKWDRHHHNQKFKHPILGAQSVAQSLGYNIDNSKFNVVNQTPSQSLIQVVQNGSNDNVNITLQVTSDGSWKVASVNQ